MHTAVPSRTPVTQFVSFLPDPRPSSLAVSVSSFVGAFADFVTYRCHFALFALPHFVKGMEGTCSAADALVASLVSERLHGHLVRLLSSNSPGPIQGQKQESTDGGAALKEIKLLLFDEDFLV